MEDGRRPVRLAEAVTLAEVLGVPLAELVAGVSDERRARFDLARAATRVKQAQAAVDAAEKELRKATEEREVASDRYNALMGFTSAAGNVQEG